MATRTNILVAAPTAGDATDQSTDQTVDSGAQVTLQLIGLNGATVPRNAVVTVELKDSGGTYRAAHELELSGGYNRKIQVQGPLAAFRVHRIAGTVGVDIVT